MRFYTGDPNVCVWVRVYMIRTNRWMEDKMDEKMMENSINKRKFHLNGKYYVPHLARTHAIECVCALNVLFSGHFDKKYDAL